MFTQLGNKCIFTYFQIYIIFSEPCVTPRVHILPQLVGAGLEPGFQWGGGRSNKERQRLQPLASVARAPLFEVRRVRFTHSPYWQSYIRYTHPPKPHSRPGHGTNVTPRVHILPQLVGACLEPGIPVREAGALTSNAKGYSL